MSAGSRMRRNRNEKESRQKRAAQHGAEDPAGGWTGMREEERAGAEEGNGEMIVIAIGVYMILAILLVAVIVENYWRK